MTFEIWWSDLNAPARKRLKAMYHENIDMSPIAYCDVEEDDLEEEDEEEE